MRTVMRSAVAGALLLWGSPVAAQHEGHTAPTAPASVNAEQVSACVQSQQQAMTLIDAANRRIEMARQTNGAAAMRSAVDDLQAALSAVRSQLASCTQLAAAAPPTDAHAGHVVPNAADTRAAADSPAAAADAHAGHVVPAPAADLLKDPRCGADVDPKTAPQASHGGRTYYFCSESDRQRFVADPARYLQAAPSVSAAADPHAGNAAASTAPVQAAPAQARQSGSTANLTITVRTVPAPPRGAAANEFEVTVKDRQGKPVEGADVSVVLVMPAMPAMKMPEMRNEVKLKGAGNGRYTGTGQIMMAGAWTATVSVKQKGKEIGQQKVTLTAK